jgi:hypothetical protein
VKVTRKQLRNMILNEIKTMTSPFKKGAKGEIIKGESGYEYVKTKDDDLFIFKTPKQPGKEVNIKIEKDSKQYKAIWDKLKLKKRSSGIGKRKDYKKLELQVVHQNLGGQDEYVNIFVENPEKRDPPIAQFKIKKSDFSGKPTIPVDLILKHFKIS